MRADKREELADQISRIPDEELRANLQQSMSGLFLFLEADLEQRPDRCRLSDQAG